MSRYLLGLTAKLYFPLLLFCILEFMSGGMDFMEDNPMAGPMDQAMLLLTMINFVLIFLYFNAQNNILKFYTFAILALTIVLIVKSYQGYNTPFIYPNVFKKVFILSGINATYILQKKTGYFNIRTLIKWIYGALALKVFTVIALGIQTTIAWGGEYRITYAKEAALLLVPLVVHWIDYCSGKDKIYLTLLDLFLIFIAQHRTVWIAGFIAVILVIIRYPLVLKKLVPVGAVLFVVGLIIFSGFILDSKFSKTLNQQVEDIFKYKEQGTGSWRYEQSEIIMARAAERPFFGWDFEAYDLGEVMSGEWLVEKGTHIHSAYLDPLYYFGIYGLLLQWFFYIYFGLRFFRLRGESLFFSVYALTLFAYGISYQIPLVSFFFLGFGLCYLEEREYSVATKHRTRFQPAL